VIPCKRSVARPEHRAAEARVVVLSVQRLHMKNFNYLVIDPGSGEAVIVDPAWQIDKIDRALADARAVLSGILVTHSHRDHIDLADPLSQRYGCPIWMSNAEIKFSGYRAERLVGHDGAPWYAGGMKIYPVATPGHTPGSTCYLIGDSLFTGDVLFYEGCGVCGDIESAHAMFDSLQRLKVLLGPETRVFSGHSYGMPPGQRFAQLLKNNIYLQFRDKETFAAFRLRKQQRLGNLFGN
jgi:hydroxyacylglutathione hydrolase